MLNASLSNEKDPAFEGEPIPTPFSATKDRPAPADRGRQMRRVLLQSTAVLVLILGATLLFGG